MTKCETWMLRKEPETLWNLNAVFWWSGGASVTYSPLLASGSTCTTSERFQIFVCGERQEAWSSWFFFFVSFLGVNFVISYEIFQPACGWHLICCYYASEARENWSFSKGVCVFCLCLTVYFGILKDVGWLSDQSFKLEKKAKCPFFPVNEKFTRKLPNTAYEKLVEKYFCNIVSEAIYICSVLYTPRMDFKMHF